MAEKIPLNTITPKAAPAAEVPTISNARVMDVIKPVAPMTNAKPGAWGYYCKKCSKIAFIFPGDEPPHLYKPIEEMEYAIAGRFRPKTRTKPLCGQCGNHVDMGLNNRVRMDRVVNVDSWCKAKGVTIDKYGYPKPETQEDSKFINKADKGGSVLTLHRLDPEQIQEHSRKCSEYVVNEQQENLSGG